MSPLDCIGRVVVEYKYDAWGNHEAEVAEEEYAVLAEKNPYRYRGYYYDSETDLYFLQTRYYDPEVGRFISRDSIEYAAPESINGLNLYAYCGNNPVMNVDPTGTFLVWLLTRLAFGGGITDIISGEIRTGYEETIDEFHYYWFFQTETGAGQSFSSKSNTPITFYVKIPDKWWNIFDYSVGVDVNINGFGWSLFVSAKEAGFSFNVKEASFITSINSLGRWSVQGRITDPSGFYVYKKISFNLPEIFVTVAAAYLCGKYVLPFLPAIIEFLLKFAPVLVPVGA